MIKRYFFAGLIIWLPIWITFVVIRFIIRLLDSTFSLVPYKYRLEQLFGHHIPGLGVLFTLIIIFLTGLLMRNFIGHRLLQFWERLLARIPLIRSIYTATKQVIDAFIQPKGESFRKVVLVEYPRKGLWSVGFVTAGNLNRLPVDDDTQAIFIPTTPNPTSGFLILAPKSDIKELNVSIEEGFKMIISLGVVMPNGKKDSPTTGTTSP